jgi:hypothetical protein
VVDQARNSVLVTYLHPNVVSHSMMDSLWSVMEYEAEHRGLLWRRFPVRSGPTSLDVSRNVQARVFLDQSDCEWLWIIDSDMGFTPDTLSRLVDAAEPERRPIVSALAYAIIEERTDGMGGWINRTVPTFYESGESGFIEVSVDRVPADSVIQVAGVGAGCLLVHRSVLEAVRAKFGDEWFSFLYYDNGKRIGEDLSFCCRVNELELPIHVHTGIKATHHKAIWLGQ